MKFSENYQFYFTDRPEYPGAYGLSDPPAFLFSEIYHLGGLHTGTIDCKRWGKQKLVTYFTLDDGRKIVAPTWPKSNYLGLAELPVGSRVELNFQPTRTGKLNLKGVTALYIPIQQTEQEMVME